MPSQIFYSSGQFIVPSTVTSVIVECWGGGGAGGSATGKGISTRAMGGGGSGGAYAKKTISVTPGQTFTVTVGKSQTSSGQQGNPSWFSTISTVYAEGGGGGQNAIAGTNTKYGTGSLGSSASSIGDIVARGGNGGYSYLNVCKNNNIGFDSGAGGGAGGRLGRGGDATNALRSASTINKTTSIPNCTVYYANTFLEGFTIDGGPGFGAGEYSGDGAKQTEEGDGFNNPCNGKNGENYGGGGSGAVKSRVSFGTCPGGAGAQGLVIITWEVNPTCICFYTSGSNCCPPQIGCTAYGDPGFTTIVEPGYYYDGTKCWIVNNSGIISATGSCGGTTTTSTTTTTTTSTPTNFYTVTQYSCPSCDEIGSLVAYSSVTLYQGTYYSIVDGYTYLVTGITSGPSYDVDLSSASSGVSCFALCIT